jgi:hypothetical protein
MWRSAAKYLFTSCAYRYMISADSLRARSDVIQTPLFAAVLVAKAYGWLIVTNRAGPGEGPVALLKI